MEQRGPSSAVRPGALSALLAEIVRVPPREPPCPRSLRPGAVIGRFELVKEIGRGGFGVVWEAKDRELRRAVAFKAVFAGAAEAREERLLSEAEAAARLAHPNIVTLHDVGRTEDGPYLVLELLRGETLGKRLEQGPLPVREALRIAVEVAKGLAHAHAHGVIHRDLTPGNVFLCDDGQVKVLDLGMAHAFGHRKLDGGTPAYMAPEQAEGAPEDERTDVFALGVVLYRMVSGELPYPGNGHGRWRAPAELDVAGAPELGAFVQRMLSPRPTDRPRDAGEVLGALGSLQFELKRSPNGSERVRTRWSRLAQRAALLAPGIAAVGAVAAALALRFARQPPPAPASDGRVLVAVADVVNETGEKELDVLSGLLVTSLEQSRKLSVMTQARVLDLAARDGRKGAARVDETLGREVGRKHAVRALLLPAIRRLGATYSLEMRAIDPLRDRHLFTLSDRATSKDALLEVLDRLSDGARRQLGEGAADVADASVQLGDAMTRSLEAYQHYLTGWEAWLGNGLRSVALREFEEAVRLDPRFASAHGALWAVYSVYGRLDLAEPHGRAAREHLGRMPEKEQGLLRLGWVSGYSHWSSALLAPEHLTGDQLHRLAATLEARFPDDKFVLAHTAEVYLSPAVDRRADAERALRRALALDAGYSYAVSTIQEILLDRPAELLEVARRAVATRRTASNLALLAQVELTAGLREAAGEAAHEALLLDGVKNSLVVWRACEPLGQLAGRPACADAWRRLLESGSNEHERDFARLRLAEELATAGHRREALQLVHSVPQLRRGDPFQLAIVLSIGLPRNDAADARAVSRLIANAVLRRYMVAAYGGAEEAERISAALTPGERSDFEEQLYAPLRLAALGRYAEAAEIQRKNRDWAHEHGETGAACWHAYLLAELLLAAGRSEDAAYVEPTLPPRGAAVLLDHAMNGTRLALVRARAMAQLGRTSDAVLELDGVLAFWKDADRDLPLLVEAKAMRERLAKATGNRLPATESSERYGPAGVPPGH